MRCSSSHVSVFVWIIFSCMCTWRPSANDSKRSKYAYIDVYNRFLIWWANHTTMQPFSYVKLITSCSISCELFSELWPRAIQGTLYEKLNCASALTYSANYIKRAQIRITGFNRNVHIIAWNSVVVTLKHKGCLSIYTLDGCKFSVHEWEMHNALQIVTIAANHARYTYSIIKYSWQHG